MPNNTLLEVKDLKMYFENKKGFLGKKIEYVKAVDGVSFKIQKGETIGLVGESPDVENLQPDIPSCVSINRQQEKSYLMGKILHS